MGNRIVWIDAFKGFLIALVVLGHALQCIFGDACEDNVVWRLIYSFHMPCFIMLSGLFAPKDVQSIGTFGKIVVRRCAQLLLPMLCWQAIYHFTPPHYSISLGSFIDCGVYWFLWALFFISVIFVFAEYLATILGCKSWIVHIAIIVILFGIMVLLDYREHGVQYISYYYPYYVFGSYYHQWMSKKSGGMAPYYIGLVIWFIAALFWNMHEPPVFLKVAAIPSSLTCYVYRYFVAILAIVVFYGLAQRFLSKENLICSLLNRIGILSLGIYTIHIIFIKLLRLVLPISINSTILVICLWLMALILSYLIAGLLSKNKTTALLLLGKIK